MNHPNLDYIRQFVNNSNPKEEYKLITEIGSGTYGDVYKALHFNSGNYVAIKIMKIDLKDDVTAICQEIHTLRECTHLNIVQFYGSYLQAAKLWICMEFCGGQSMQDIYLNLRHPIDEDTIAFITRETLSGLQYMHKRNRMHRDIKGANILLTDRGDVKIADFGIAAKLSATVAKRTTLIGTPYWMAPEVAAVNNRSGGYDERCDIWAVGITAIEYAELQPPMFDLHPMKALQILGQRSYTPPKLQKRDHWTIKFHMFLKQALMKNERKRPNAELLLTHEFVNRDALTVQLTRNLLSLNRKDKLPVYMTKPNDNKPEQKVPLSEVTARNVIQEHRTENSRIDPLAMSNIIVDKKLPILNEKQIIENLLLVNGDGIEDEGLLICVNKELEKRGHQPLINQERNSLYDNCSNKPNDNNETQVENDKISSSLGDLNSVGSPSSDPSYPSASGTFSPQRPKSIANETLSGSTQKPMRPNKPPQYLPELCRSDPSSSAAPISSSVTTNHKNSQQSAPNNQPNQMNAVSNDVEQSSIPPIPRVHMGACFILIFEGCPLKINSSGSWINPDTKEKLILLGTNDGIYYLNTNTMHDNNLEMLTRRRCLWLSVIRDTMMSLSGGGPQLYIHNLVSLIRSKHHEQTMERIANKILPKRFQPTSKLPNTKGCQMVSIIRNPFTGSKYMCAAVGKQIFLYEWFSPHSSFIEIKRVEASGMPCPLLNFDLLVSREQNFPIVCLGVSKTADRDRFKLNLVNMEESNRSVWFKSSEESETNMDLVKVLQIEPNTLLVCFPDRAIFLNMSGKVKTGRSKINSLEFGTYINSVVGLRDSILAFHTHGLKGIDFGGQTTQDITDEKHIYRLLSSDTYTASILVESKTTDNPMDNGNIYMLVGHQDQS